MLCFGFVMKTAMLTLWYFYLLKRSAYTEPRIFLLLVLPCQRGAEGAQGAGRRHSQDSWSRQAKEIFHAL